MEKDELIEGELFGDEELYDFIPDENEIDYDENPEKIGSINWVNGKPALSFSSLCDKTKSIFTQVKGIPIDVREAQDENYIYKSDNRYVINIAKDPVKGISKYTAFNHELGHYAFDSFNNQFPKYVYTQLNMIPEEHHDKAMELYRSVYNIIEDQRIESLMGGIYLGTGKRFRQSRRRLGSLKPKDHKTINPLDALHCAREYRDDAIIGKYKLATTILSDIEMTDGEASVLLAKEYIDKVVNPWIISQLKNCKNPFPRSKNKPIKGNFKVDDSQDITATKKLDDAFKEAFSENRSSDHREMENDLSDEQVEQLNDGLEKQEQNKLQEALSKSVKNAETKVNKIMDTIEENARKQKRSSMGENRGMEMVDRTIGSDHVTVDPNYRVARNINRVLKLIQSRSKPKIRDIGENISIPHVIKRMALGYGDVMIKQQPAQKTAILVLIDASGSMDGAPIRIARNMMGTLYKSIENTQGIELRGVVWAGGSKGCLISDVKSYKDCKTIHCNKFSGGTPTAQAVEYGVEVIRGMRAKKKLMIVITDGYPNSVYNSKLTAEQVVRKSVNKARSEGIGTMGLMVGMETDKHMNKMFGEKGHVGVYNMEEASDVVIKKFKNVVMSQTNAR